MSTVENVHTEAPVARAEEPLFVLLLLLLIMLLLMLLLVHWEACLCLENFPSFFFPQGIRGTEWRLTFGSSKCFEDICAFERGGCSEDVSGLTVGGGTAAAVVIQSVVIASEAVTTTTAAAAAAAVR